MQVRRVQITSDHFSLLTLPAGYIILTVTIGTGVKGAAAAVFVAYNSDDQAGLLLGMLLYCRDTIQLRR